MARPQESGAADKAACGSTLRAHRIHAYNWTVSQDKIVPQQLLDSCHCAQIPSPRLENFPVTQPMLRGRTPHSLFRALKGLRPISASQQPVSSEIHGQSLSLAAAAQRLLSPVRPPPPTPDTGKGPGRRCLVPLLPFPDQPSESVGFRPRSTAPQLRSPGGSGAGLRRSLLRRRRAAASFPLGSGGRLAAASGYLLPDRRLGPDKRPFPVPVPGLERAPTREIPGDPPGRRLPGVTEAPLRAIRFHPRPPRPFLVAALLPPEIMTGRLRALQWRRTSSHG
ncbi:uncharacterized protein LOC121101661 [Ursus maritimus]|uniref:Uncharacterized protein LOC121101661 n=1 Tax=Ursus maritimus TaxID=29073 RepID=A0A8M1FHX1_URSMA|nr:uncharacterized protein LOC121101661 [Ursus maritimus]